MPFLNVKNRAESTLASGISDSDLSLTVATGEGAKFPASNFHITIEDEILLCSSRTGDVLTVVREKEGTSAAAHAEGKTVELRITAKIIQDLIDRGFLSLADTPSAYTEKAGKLLLVNATEDALEFAGDVDLGYHVLTALTVSFGEGGNDAEMGYDSGAGAFVITNFQTYLYNFANQDADIYFDFEGVASDTIYNFPNASGTIALQGLAGTKIYYVADSSGGAVTRKLTFINGILTAET